MIARLLHTAIQPQTVLHRKNAHRDGVQNEKLQIEQVVNAVHRFQNHGKHRNNDPNHNEVVKHVVQLTTVLTGKDQGVNFLSECSAMVGFHEFFVSRNQNPEEFQNSQQSQESQETQINRYEGLQVKGQDGYQVNQCKGAGGVACSCKAMFLKLLILGCEVKPSDIFN